MVHKKEESTYHHIEKLTKEMPVFLSPGKGLPLLLIPQYSGINKEQRIPDRSKTAYRKPPVKWLPDREVSKKYYFRIKCSLNMNKSNCSFFLFLDKKNF